MVSQAAARNVVGIIGNVISFGLFLSPVPTFWRIIKAKDTEEFSPNPYLATLLNCMLWVFYGIPVVHPNSILVVTINGIGLVIEAAYLTIFFLYANSNKKRKRALAILVVEFLFMIAVVLSVLLAAHTHKKRSLIVGILCIIFGTMMYFSPLTVMKQVVTTKSVEYMPFLLSLASFLNGCCWTIYALMPFDLNLVVPNGLGAVFGLVQLILYACYYKTTPKKQKSVELPTTVATSNVGSGGGGGGGNVTVTVER